MRYAYFRVLLVVGALANIGAGCTDDSLVSFDVGQKSAEVSVGSVKSDSVSSPVVSESKPVSRKQEVASKPDFSFWIPEDLRLETHNQGWTLQKKSEPNVNTPGAGSEDINEPMAPIEIHFSKTDMKSNADFLPYPSGFVSGEVEKFNLGNASCEKALMTEGIMLHVAYSCIIKNYVVSFTDFLLDGNRDTEIRKIISSFSINNTIADK